MKTRRECLARVSGGRLSPCDAPCLSVSPHESQARRVRVRVGERGMRGEAVNRRRRRLSRVQLDNSQYTLAVPHSLSALHTATRRVSPPPPHQLALCHPRRCSPWDDAGHRLCSFWTRTRCVCTRSQPAARRRARARSRSPERLAAAHAARDQRPRRAPPRRSETHRRTRTQGRARSEPARVPRPR